MTHLIENGYTSDADSEWFGTVIDKFHHPQKYKTEKELAAENPPAFAELFDEFLTKHPLSEVRKKNFRVVKRALMRYELFVREACPGMKDFVLDINTVTKDTLADIWQFMENEYTYVEEYPEIYAVIPEKRTPKPRGKNTLIDSFSRIRTFFLWCYNQGKTSNRPFDKFPIEECLYGTPVYITLNERNRLFEADLSANQDFEQFKGEIRAWLDTHPDEYDRFVAEVNDKSATGLFKIFKLGLRLAPKMMLRYKRECRGRRD